MPRHSRLRSAAFAGLFLLSSCVFLLSPHGGRFAAGERIAGAKTLPGDAVSPGERDDLYHWPRLPVRIFIPQGDSQEQRWARIAVAGFDEWVCATHGVVAYTQVADSTHAQIRVRFVPTPAVPQHPDLVGLTTTYWVGSVLQNADVVLATGGKSPGDLQTAAAHELGHALGIRGHSEDPDDLMFPAPIRHPRGGAHPIMAGDLDTLKLCYPSLFSPSPITRSDTRPLE